MTDKAKTDTSKPESVKLDEFKRKFKKRKAEGEGNTFLLKGVQEGPAKRFTTLKKVSLDMPKIILSDGAEFKAKGGRVELRGGGICKKGMNKKAVGKNS